MRPLARPPVASLCALMLMICGLLTTNQAGAQIYKWVDENGRVNYANKAPPDTVNKAAVTVIDDNKTTVSVYQPTQDTAASAEVTELRNKVNQLQQEVDSARQASQQPASPAPGVSTAAYEQCIAEKRVDCDKPDAVYSPDVLVVAPRKRPPALLPVPLPAKKPPQSSAQNSTQPSKVRPRRQQSDALLRTD